MQQYKKSDSVMEAVNHVKNSAMEADTISKNGRSSKSHKNRRNLLSLLFVSLLFAVTNVMLGQTQQQNTSLPKKAKLQAIIYPKTGVIAVGYVEKKQFVENQKLTFLEKSGRNVNLGLYFISERDGVFYIQSRYDKNDKQPLSSLDTIASGMYFTKDGNAYISGILHSNLINKSVYGGVFQISNTKAGNNLTTNPNETFYSLLSYQYTNKLKISIADIYSYQGYYNSKNPVTLQKHAVDYLLKIKFDDRILETFVSSDDVKKYGFLTFDDLIKSSQNVTLNYTNGNVFVGVVEKKYDDDKYTPKQGEFRFKTGEIYKGILGGRYLWYINGRIFVPDQGETTFADGTTANGDWLKQYNFTDNEWQQIYGNSKSLTEIRDNAVRVNEEKQIKLREEKIAKAQAEQEKLLEEQQRKQEYISKYGEHFGTLISQGALEVGMSQAMVGEVWNKDFFVVSKSVRNGKSFEIWEFSKDKMQIAIMNEGVKNKDNGGGEAALAAIFLMELSESLGGPTVPKMIIFTNNKLTDIYR